MIIVATLAFAAAAVPIMRMTPYYRAGAVVQVNDVDTNNIDANKNAPADADEASSKICTDIDIITTRVMDRVADKLNLWSDPEFSNRSGWRIWVTERLVPMLGGTGPAPGSGRAATSETLRDRLSVWNDGHSNSIHIAFSSESAAKAAKVADALGDAFIADQIEVKRATDDRASARLSQRLEELELHLKASAQSLESYRESASLLPIGAQAVTMTSQQLAEFSTQLVTAQVQRAQAEAKLQDTLRAVKDPAASGIAADVIDSPLIQKLRESESTLLTEQAQLKEQYGPLHPRVLAIEAELHDFRNKLQDEIKRISQSLANDVTVAQARERMLTSKVTDLEAQLAAAMRAGVHLQELTREESADRKLYEFVLDRVKEVEARKGIETADANIISYADLPATPAPPGKTTLLGLALLLSVLLAILVAFVLERME